MEVFGGVEVKQWRSTMVDSGGAGETRAGAAVVVLGKLGLVQLRWC